MFESGSATPTADILVVDDTPDNIRFLSSMLTASGYAVRPAISGKIALRAAQTITPDLILLDINMPEMDGYQVCQELKAHPKTQPVPIIFLSALDDVKDKVKAFQVGGSDYISKPFQMDEVLARIANQLTIRQLQKEVESRNQQLEVALNDLQTAQLTLIQNEKMTALGQLVAGIAHEINNPVSFIYGNLTPAMNYVQDLLELVSLYQRAYPQPVPEIVEQLEELDIEFLTDDLSKIMTSMQTGANRIREIVLGLRSFSRLDEAQCKTADVVEGLESTLAMMRSRLEPDDQPPITLLKHHEPIPAINCYPAQLNQVFFHLLVNAIDAIRTRLARSDSFTPQIRLSTRQPNPETIEIAIADNGIGMDEQTQTHLFNPFFSNKPIGQGTGLGLSICYRIIHDTHQGAIAVTSAPDQGTLFTIHLPTTLPLPDE